MNKYEIKAITDLLAVPEDKIDACLADLRQWIDFARETAEIREMFGAITESFVWVDDGVCGISGITVVVKGAAE